MSVLNTMLDPDVLRYLLSPFLAVPRSLEGTGVLCYRGVGAALRLGRPPTRRVVLVCLGGMRDIHDIHVGAWINSLQVVRKNYAINQNPASSATSHL